MTSTLEIAALLIAQVGICGIDLPKASAMNHKGSKAMWMLMLHCP